MWWRVGRSCRVDRVQHHRARWVDLIGSSWSKCWWPRRLGQQPAVTILLLQAALLVMVPATVCLVSLVQGLLDELHHISSVLSHAVRKRYHAAEHGDSSLRAAGRPLLFEPVYELHGQHRYQETKSQGQTRTQECKSQNEPKKAGESKRGTKESRNAKQLKQLKTGA